MWTSEKLVLLVYMPCQYLGCESKDLTVDFNGINYCMTHLAKAMSLSPPTKRSTFQCRGPVEEDKSICESCSA